MPQRTLRHARRSGRFLIAAAVALSTIRSDPASATSVISLKFEALVAQASTIVRTEAIDTRSEWRDGEGGRGIVTVVTFRVRSTIKGTPSDTLRLEFFGGTIGEETLRVADMPRFTVGDRDILFVNDAGRPVSPIVGFAQGRFRILLDLASGREMVMTHDGKPLIGTASIGQPSRRLSTAGFPRTAAQPSASDGLSVDAFEAAIRRELGR
jgi:hypothetical protein